MSNSNPLSLFHPVVSAWFSSVFEEPSEAQALAWPRIREGHHTLIAAPTGSGKTLAAFFSAIDDLVRQGLEGKLEERTQVLYISPLKALGNDIERNLQFPLKGILHHLAEAGLPAVNIRARVRTGDTPAAHRAAMLKYPPHILVTTPESLYLLLTSEGGRKMLSGVKTVIVDEIHALIGDKRGSHLALSLERLKALSVFNLQRIGLSATQKPIGKVARFLAGSEADAPEGKPNFTIVDTGHSRKIDLKLEVPRSPLSAVMANEIWDEIYERLEELVRSHHTTLIFVNTRRLAERLAHHLTERLGALHVAAHHGSLSKEQRFAAEKNLKEGQLKVLVATASMELGIDIGDVDLVCQISSPRAISTLLQRVGRSGHFIGGIPKGRIFPLTRDDLVECAALLDAIRRDELDEIVMPEKPLDVLAQQIVAEVANREWSEMDLFKAMKGAYPYRDLQESEFMEILEMLSEGFTTRRGRRSAYLHHDRINGIVRGRRGARLSALINGGAIPDTFNYDVILEPSNTFVGSLDEDFAIESMAGDIFQLGNQSWRVMRVENGKVRVENANGLPPSIPFWLGEAAGRTEELSFAVSRLRKEVADRILDPRPFTHQGEGQAIPADSLIREWGGAALDWLTDQVGLSEAAAEQLTFYLAGAKMALGGMPTRERIVMERFFDEAGDMHLVVHAPFGSRINRAWGLALRKRFCRNFNFELQAAAIEDALVLSLGSTHSFPLEEVFDYLQPHNVREILVQALLDAPMFGVRWRWNASRALAIQRRKGGKRVAPQLQRMEAEDLVALVFPDQLACLENIAGDREIPDHPLVRQTIHDCLTEAMDIDHLEKLIGRIVSGKVELVALDLREPSPLAQEILNSNPYSFLDPAPLEERRTRAVRNRRWLDPSEAADLGKLDPLAIARVREEAWPQPRDADELHDALILHGFIAATEGENGAEGDSWEPFFRELASQGRATMIRASASGPELWVAAERLPQWISLFPGLGQRPPLSLPVSLTKREWEPEEALKEIVRGRLEGLGPISCNQVAASMGMSPERVDRALHGLENEGFAFRGHFSPEADGLEWCERRLLARIHSYTLKRLRQEIEPVSTTVFMRFLFSWQKLTPGDQGNGPAALQEILAQLEGYEAPAAAWEGDILPARMEEYDPIWLDVLCMSGRLIWGRFRPPVSEGKKSGPVRSSPLSLVSRENLDLWLTLGQQNTSDLPELSHEADKVLEFLRARGAVFFDEISKGTRLLDTQIENALGELATQGLVSSDGFTGLRALLTPLKYRPGQDKRRGSGNQATFGMAHAGRWNLVNGNRTDGEEETDRDREEVARILLRRYGIVFRKLAEREAILPPWRDLVRVFRRMEARGEIRGGRFVDGVGGEQFALPEAVGKLRKIRSEAGKGELVSLSAVDPANLTGILGPERKVTLLTGNRVLFRDGVPVAVLEGKEVTFWEEMETGEKWELQKSLVRRIMPPKLRAYLGGKK